MCNSCRAVEGRLAEDEHRQEPFDDPMDLLASGSSTKHSIYAAAAARCGNSDAVVWCFREWFLCSDRTNRVEIL